jgi:dienelactone hydrolase
MTEVLLFHHAQGQTTGFHVFADELRGAGHTVHTPDLFDGRTFESIDEGLAYVREHGGFGEVIERGAQAAQALPDALVYAGFSLGVVPAQKLAQTRRGARGALLFYSCLPVSEFGTWPPDVPVQIHGMDADPFFVDEGDVDAARELVESADDADALPLPRRPALLRRQQPAELRRGRDEAPDGACPRVPRAPWLRRGRRMLRVSTISSAGLAPSEVSSERPAAGGCRSVPRRPP